METCHWAIARPGPKSLRRLSRAADRDKPDRTFLRPRLRAVEPHLTVGDERYQGWKPLQCH